MHRRTNAIFIVATEELSCAGMEVLRSAMCRVITGHNGAVPVGDTQRVTMNPRALFLD